jgi:diacylglycerol O-acyltransferase
VISNVPGPPVPIYFMGALVEAMYPLGPIFHQAGLNITVISSNGKVHVGLIACPDQVDDLDVLAERFHDELDALVAACNLTSPTGN